jgi:hypothetical protein
VLKLDVTGLESQLPHASSTPSSFVELPAAVKSPLSNPHPDPSASHVQQPPRRDVKMLEPDDQEKCDPEKYIRPGDKDLVVQLVLSLIIGVSSFVAFCVRNPSL